MKTNVTFSSLSIVVLYNLFVIWMINSNRFNESGHQKEMHQGIMTVKCQVIIVVYVSSTNYVINKTPISFLFFFVLPLITNTVHVHSLQQLQNECNRYIYIYIQFNQIIMRKGKKQMYLRTDTKIRFGINSIIFFVVVFFFNTKDCNSLICLMGSVLAWIMAT